MSISSRNVIAALLSNSRSSGDLAQAGSENPQATAVVSNVLAWTNNNPDATASQILDRVITEVLNGLWAGGEVTVVEIAAVREVLTQSADYQQLIQEKINSSSLTGASDLRDAYSIQTPLGFDLNSLEDSFGSGFVAAVQSDPTLLDLVVPISDAMGNYSDFTAGQRQVDVGEALSFTRAPLNILYNAPDALELANIDLQLDSSLATGASYGAFGLQIAKLGWSLTQFEPGDAEANASFAVSTIGSAAYIGSGAIARAATTTQTVNGVKSLTAAGKASAGLGAVGAAADVVVFSLGVEDALERIDSLSGQNRDIAIAQLSLSALGTGLAVASAIAGATVVGAPVAAILTIVNIVVSVINSILGLSISLPTNFYGTAGDDTIGGNHKDNYIYGYAGDDVLDGGAGNDTLYGGIGDDILRGGSGDDVLYGGAGDDSLYGGAGRDVLLGNSGNDLLSPGRHSVNGGVEHADGGAGIDTITFASLPTYYDAGRSRYFERYGPDTLDYYTHTVTKRFDATGGIVGSLDSTFSQEFTLTTIDQTNQRQYGSLLPAVVTRESIPAVTRTVDVENVIGTQRGDSITGNDKDNILSGLSGNDSLAGGAGNDVLSGGFGDDTLIGGAGNDLVTYYLDRDERQGHSGHGFDINLETGVTKTRSDNVNRDSLSQIENATGSVLSDLITGDSQRNILNGRDGADELRGLGGNDVLLGGNQNDTLYGGTGNDVLSGGAYVDHLDGGAGIDTVNYQIEEASGRDSTGFFIDLGFGQTRSLYVNNSTYIADTLVSIENAIGTDYDDQIYGDEGANLLLGDAGVDYISGDGGHDVLSPGGYEFSQNAGQSALIWLSGSATTILSGGLNTNYGLTQAQMAQFVTDSYSSNEGSHWNEYTAYWMPQYHPNTALQIDLGGLYLVEDLSIMVDNNDNYLVEYSVDGTTWHRLTEVQASWGEIGDGIDRFTTLESDPLEYESRLEFSAQQAKYLKISSPSGDSGRSVSDVKVYGKSLDGAAIAGNLDIVEGRQSIPIREVITGSQIVLTDGSSAETLADGVLPESTISWDNDDFTTSWTDGNGVLVHNNTVYNKFVLDLGATYEVTGLNLAVDHNDSYVIRYATEADPTNFQSLAYIDQNWESDGRGAIDRYSTLPSVIDRFYNQDFANNFAQSFDSNGNGPVARYIEVYGVRGDGHFAIGEVEVFGKLQHIGDYQISPNDVEYILGGEGFDTINFQLNESDKAGFLGEGYNIDLDALHPGVGTYFGTGYGGSTQTLLGITGAEGVVGSDKDDTITGSDDVNRLSGAGGNDVIYGKGGDDSLSGGSGLDVIHGGSGSDTLNYQANDEDKNGHGGHGYHIVIREDGSGSSIRRSDGITAEDTFTGVENISGTDLNDYLEGNSLTNVLAGGDGVDVLYGRDGNDILLGGFGNDILFGGEGGDVLIGGDGNDDIRGGADIDTFRFETRAGDADTIADFVTGERIEVNLRSEFITDPVITSVTNGQRITFTNSDGATYIINVMGAVALTVADLVLTAEARALANGTTGAVDGTAADDNITGTSADDTIRGLDGDDILRGGELNDTLYGNDGDDILAGGAGTDAIHGGNGQDILNYQLDDEDRNGDNGAGYHIVIGADGSGNAVRRVDGVTIEDSFTGIEHIYGTDQGDHLEGNGNDNLLSGGGGNDTILGGSGNDHLRGDAGNDAIIAGAGHDRLEGGAGVDHLTGGAGNDVFHLQTRRGDVDTINDYQSGDLIRIDMISDTNQGLLGQFNYDPVLTQTENGYKLVWDRYVENGHPPEYAINIITTEVLTLDDIEFNVAEDRTTDALVTEGTIQNETIRAGNTIENRTINGNGGDDILLGSDGADTLRGGDGNDTLSGSYNEDTLDGGNGSDTVNYQLNDHNGAANSDRAGHEGSGFIINLLTGESRTIIGNGLADRLVSIENVVGSDRGDVITGDAENNVLAGIRGDDTINGGAGDDILSGGAGNDTIDGGDGFDVVDYSYDIVDNQFGIYIDYASGEVKRIGAHSSDTSGTIASLSLSSVEDNFSNIEAVVGTIGADRFVADNSGGYLFNGGSGLDALDLSALTSGENLIVDLQAGTGLVMSNSFDIANVENVIGGAGADTITGSFSINTIRSGAGNDKIILYTGGDTIDGGSGVDVLDLSALQSRAGVNLQSSENVNIKDSYGVEVSVGNGSYVVFAANDATSDEALIGNLAGVENIVGTSFDDVIYGDDQNNQIEGGLGDDILHGGFGADSLFGGIGNDTINGGYNRDVLDGGAGNDILSGGEWNDTILGGDGDDTLNGDDGSDLLQGGDGHDTLNGGNHRDTLEGGAGDDVLFGGGFNDTLIGGADSDTLTGGLGADIFVFGANFGSDTVTDFEHGHDIFELQLAASEIDDVSDLTITQQGGDVLISAGTDGSIVVNNDSALNFDASDFRFV